MIDVEVSGTLPEVNTDFTEILGEIGDYMFDSVRLNFIAGGRPNTWQPLVSGTPSHLIDTGMLFKSLQMTSDGFSATVFVDTNEIPYAAIHNFGGVINVAGRQKVSFEQRRYTGGFKKGQFMKGKVAKAGHETKAFKINMPQRQFMLFQEEDKEWILQKIAMGIFSESGKQII